MKNQNLLAYASLAGAMIFWSLSFIWYKQAYLFFGPITVIFLRLIIATVLMIATGFLLKNFQNIHRKHFGLFALLAFFEPFLYFMAESHGMKFTSPTIASIIISLIPLLTPLALSIFLKRTTDITRIFGIIVSFVGATIVVVSDSTDLASNGIGVALMFGAVISALGYSIVLTKVLEYYNTITVMVFQNLLSVIYFAPFFFLIEYSYWRTIPFSLQSYEAVIKLAVFASYTAFSLFVIGIRRVGVTVGNMFAYLIPVFTAVFAYFILNERLSWWKFGGIFTVMVGLMLPGFLDKKTAQ